MYLNKLYLFILFISIYTNTFSQNELKDLSFTSYPVPVHYWRYPATPLGEEYKTFSVTANAENSFISSYIKEHISIVYFSKMDRGDLNIDISVNNFVFNDIEKNRSEIKDKDGRLKEIRYTVRLLYYYSIKGKVLNNKTGETLIKELSWEKGSQRSPEVWAREYSDEHTFNNETSAEKMDKIKTGIMQEAVETVCKEASNICTYRFSTDNIETTDNVLRINEDDYYEHYFYLKQVQELASIFKKMNRLDALTQYKEELVPIMNYFETIITRYAQKSPKVSNKVAAASYYNLGIIHYYLDDPEKTKQYGEKVLELKEFGYQAKSLVEKANDLKNNLTLNNKTSRHGQL